MVAQRTRLAGWFLAAVGSALALVLLADLAASAEPTYWVIEAYPVVLTLLLVGAGVLLARGALVPDRSLARLLGWLALGVLALSVLSVYLYFLAIEFAGNEMLDTPVGAITILTFGALIGLLVGVYDARAVERKRAVERRERELEAHNERLDEFASLVSHDLRNPLNIMLGHAELLRDERDSPHLDSIARAGDRMQEIIADLLSLSRAGRTIDRWEQVSLAAVARRSWTTVPTGDSDLTLDVPDDSTVAADEARLRNVFENLYRNAIGHNDAAVTVTVGLLDGPSERDGDAVAGFYVEDDGVGIDSSRRETVFDDGYTTDAAGTGLGLSIVADIVDAHGWTVSAAAGERGGARFEIRASAGAGR